MRAENDLQASPVALGLATLGQPLQSPELRLVEDAALGAAPSVPGVPETPVTVTALTFEAGAADAVGSAWRASAAVVVKRVLDVVISCLLLVLLAPVLALIALCVVLDSEGPVFYRAVRVGVGGRRLQVLKFRKMRSGARGAPLTVAHDERFTRIGGWLARTKLDELPQLFNVVRGEMSLIGPRPEDAAFVRRHAEAFDVILMARPGITGLAQLAYRAESEILDRRDPIADYERRVLPQKLALDRLYVARANPVLDLQILVWTFLTTFMAIPVSVDRTSAHIGLRLSRGGRRMPADGWWAALPKRPAGARVATQAESPSHQPSIELDNVERGSQ